MLLYDEPMAKHTTWRAGGPARHYFRPEDLADLSDFLRSLPPGEPLLWLGLGSNLLVRDGGFPGTVIALQGRLDEIEPLEGARLRVGRSSNPRMRSTSTRWRSSNPRCLKRRSSSENRARFAR